VSVDSETKSAIVEIVHERWAQDRAPLLYSQVPGALKLRGIDYKEKLAGQPLRSAIEAAKFRDIVSLQSPADEKIWALAPANTGCTTEEIFFRYRASGEKTAPSARRRRFDRNVWLAFTTPLLEDHVRYISFSAGMPEMQDLPAQGERAPDLILVKREYIRPLPSERTFDDVARNIESWCAENKVELGRLLYVAPKVEKVDFWARLGALSDDDLSRVSIPADIIRKLLN
jgi:hypothetical protein